MLASNDYDRGVYDIEKNAAHLKSIGKIEMHKFFHEMALI